MSATLARPVPAGGAAGPSAFASAAPARDPLSLRLAAFAALTLFGVAHWASLVDDAPLGRTLLVVAIATAGATALGLLGRLTGEAGAPRLPAAVARALDGPGAPRLPAAVARALHGPRGGTLVAVVAVAIGLLTLLAALLAAGLPLRLLAPAHWDELAGGLDRGLAGVQGIDWPYGGQDEWIRRTVLLGAPLLAALAAALAFFPARRAAPLLRAAGLVVLLVLYGTAATEHDPGAPLLRGLVLLALVAAWLWLPRLARGEALTAAAALAAVGIGALPFAAALDAEQPWWDYRAWSWLGDGKLVSFDWTHQYGPLDWPREGTTLLYVRSDRPHYWKAQTLDSFDGFRWVHTPRNDTSGLVGELPPRPPDGRWDPFEVNPRWDERLRFTVGSLSSDLVLSAGVPYDWEGVQLSSRSGDGTARAAEPLEKGEGYEVRVYAPDPSAEQMRAATLGYTAAMGQYTEVFLPNPGEDALVGNGRQGDAARSAEMLSRDRVRVPLHEGAFTDAGGAGRRLLDSPYGEVYRLARRLTAGEPTAYDAVKAVERHLQSEYVYSERPPSQEYPLAAFLFEDRIGYCQQFSGAMALMLRMGGIPARVSAGFSPGSFNKDTGEYRVRDLDAHSWVEVYFTGIGWVPFDPTPTAAPAGSQSAGPLATSAARADAGDVRQGAAAASERGTDRGGGATGGEGSGWLGPALLAAVLLASGGVLLQRRRAGARRALGSRGLADAQLLELRRALVRLGWELPPGTTLLDLERRLGRVAGPASAGYAAALRAHRYDGRAPTAPGATERRALRRELTARAGLRARLRGLAALPPGGPRPV